MEHADGLADLEHDHADLNERVRAVAAQVRALGRQPDADALARVAAEMDELREEIFVHFAREEEGLFAYVTVHMVGFEDDVAALIGAHDAVCGAISRMLRSLRVDGPDRGHELLVSVLDRLEVAYAAHARAERDLLGRLAGSMSADQRAALAAHVRAL